MLVGRQPVGATHAAYSDHVATETLASCAETKQAGVAKTSRDQNSLYHAPNPGAPRTALLQIGPQRDARGWKRPFDDPIALHDGGLHNREAADYLRWQVSDAEIRIHPCVCGLAATTTLARLSSAQAYDSQVREADLFVTGVALMPNADSGPRI
jgi:hypothetical protein